MYVFVSHALVHNMIVETTDRRMRPTAYGHRHARLMNAILWTDLCTDELTTTVLSNEGLRPEAGPIDAELPDLVADDPFGGVEQLGGTRRVAAGRLEGILDERPLVGRHGV